MRKYGKLEKLPVSWKLLAVEHKLAQFYPTGVERGYICATSGTFANGELVLKQTPRPMGLLLIFYMHTILHLRVMLYI